MLSDLGQAHIIICMHAMLKAETGRPLRCRKALPSSRSPSTDVHYASGAVLGLKQPDVLGWSMGGMIMLELATSFPSAVGNLVLADTTLGGAPAVPL